MKKNMGSTDRIIRIVLAVIIAGLYYGGFISGTLGIVLLAVAVVFAVTSFVSFCPAYVPFGLNTCSTENKK
jgi:hypothetical protein